MKLEVGMYVRTKRGQIGKIITIGKYNITIEFNGMWQDIISKENIVEASFNIVDLVKYMDLLEVENPIKLYDKDKEAILFNPIRCDGFTTYDDGTTCIILNLDYFVDVKNLKIKTIVTKEQFEQMSYEVSE